MIRFALTLLFLAVLALACGQTPTGLPPSPVESPVPTLSASPVGSPGFTIGLEYAIPGLAAAYAPTKVTLAKPQPVFGMWGLIEPKPGEYNWAPLDNLVAEYQQAGFHGIQLLITAESPWASIRPPTLTDPGDTFPKEEYVQDYVDFVTRFVERYDGDGIDDAPGLLYPVHQFGIEREFSGFWPGTADEYVRLLRLAYPAVHAADPQAEVLLVAVLMVDVFDGNPGPSELQRRLNTPRNGIRKSVPDIKTILAACDYYDMVDFHSLGDYTEIPPTTAWLREQLAADGCAAKPIVIGDAFSMSGLVGYNNRPAWPGTSANLERVDQTLKLVANPGSSGHTEAQSWLYALMASSLVKKSVVSAAEGLAGINLGNLEDWKTGIPGVDAAAVPLIGTSMFMGMMDTKITNRQVGDQLPAYRSPGPPRPAFYAVRLVVQKIAGFTAAQKLDLGENVWAYRFDRPSGSLWVLWYDDGVLYFPGETPPSQSVDLPFPGGEALVTRTPSQTGDATPSTQTLAHSNGNLSLTIDSTPLFVETR